MKILVNVSVPAIAQRWDVLVPDTIRIRTVVAMIAETAEKLSNDLYISSGREFLCSTEKNIVLRPNETLERYGIQNGDHLTMI